MPILREQRRIGPVQPGGVSRPQVGDVYARQVSQLAGTVMDGAQTIGRMMMDGEVDDAVALAQQAAISIDENGVPQVDRSARDKMTRYAARAYDRTLDERFRHRLTIALQAKAAQLAVEHENDPTAFRDAMVATVEGMAGSVPEAFHAYWQDEAARIGAQHGAQIGRAQADKVKMTARADYNNMATAMFERIGNLAFTGDEAEIKDLRLVFQMTSRELLKQGWIMPDEIAEAERDLNAAAGIGSLRKIIAENDWTSEDYQVAYFELRAGTSPYAGLFPDEASRHKGASMLAELAAGKAAQERAETDRIEIARFQADVAAGLAPTGTKKEIDDAAEAMDVILGADPNDWLDEDYVASYRIWSQIQTSGVLPASLQGVFRKAARPGGFSPEKTEIVVRMWRELSYGRAPDGSATTLASQIPDDVTERFLLMTAFMEFGGEDIAEADAWARDFAVKGFNEPLLAQRAAALDGDRDWRPETVRDQLAEFVREHISRELETEMTPGDAEIAATWLAKLLQTGRAAPDDAVAMLTQQFRNRYLEVEGVYNPAVGLLARAPGGPEHVYAVPTDQQGWYRRFSMAEGVYRPTWFETYAEEWIRPRLIGDAALAVGTDKLIYGFDYVVQPVGADPLRPNYRVFIANDGGTWTLINEEMSPAAAHAAELARLRAASGPTYDEELMTKLADITDMRVGLAQLPPAQAADFERMAKTWRQSMGWDRLQSWSEFRKAVGK